MLALRCPSHAARRTGLRTEHPACPRGAIPSWGPRPWAGGTDLTPCPVPPQAGGRPCEPPAAPQCSSTCWTSTTTTPPSKTCPSPPRSPRGFPPAPPSSRWAHPTPRSPGCLEAPFFFQAAISEARGLQMALLAPRSHPSLRPLPTGGGHRPGRGPQRAGDVPHAGGDAPHGFPHQQHQRARHLHCRAGPGEDRRVLPAGGGQRRRRALQELHQHPHRQRSRNLWVILKGMLRDARCSRGAVWGAGCSPGDAQPFSLLQCWM